MIINLGAKNIVFFQGLNLCVMLIWCVIMLPFLILDFSSSIGVFIFTIFIFSTLMFFYFKLRQIEVIGTEISIRNLFSEKTFSRNYLKGIEKTTLTPLIFKVIFEGREYYFASDIITFYQALFRFDSDYALNKLRGKINLM